MDSGHGKKRINNNINNNTERAADRLHSKKSKKEIADRLSSLPNHLIHKILSFISIKETVKTIVLSSRYRFIWTTMPYLNFSTRDFPKLEKFAKFVAHFLSRRNTQIDVFSLKLSYRGKVNQRPVKKLMDYAFSHNIQQLDVKCLLLNNIEFPLSLFCSHSLKNLSLKKETWSSKTYKATSTFKLPALTTLYLHDVTFCSHHHTDNCVDLLSKCANLKNLTLQGCETEGMSSFSVCHPGLSNLTLDAGLNNVKVVNVVAPQLENLILRHCSDNTEYVITAPDLTSLVYKGYHALHLSTDGFHSLKGADICVIHPKVEDAHQMVCLLQHLHNVKFLTLNLELVELLSSSVELISDQPSPFVNLKSLTIYPKKLSEWEMRGLTKGKVKLSTEVKNYLLDGSPGATFTMFSREEILAVKDLTSAQKLMAELRVLLEQEKTNTKTKGKAPMESHNEKTHEKGKIQQEMKMQLQIGGNMSLIKSCWKDLSAQFEQRKAKACLIISKLESSEGLLTKLPASNQATIQPCFSSLCAEAVIVMSKITDCLKIQCDESQIRLTAGFR